MMVMVMVMPGLAERATDDGRRATFSFRISYGLVTDAARMAVAALHACHTAALPTNFGAILVQFWC